MALTDFGEPGRPTEWGADPMPEPSSSLSLPTGTVTFLLTDVEGSTLAWQSRPDAMQAAIARHYELLDLAIESWHGVRPLEQGEGDSVVAAFSRPSDAIAAALDAQRALAAEPWPGGLRLQVRMALHTGEATQRDQHNYVGTTIIRAARIRNAGHGGQILLSDATVAVVGDRLPDDVTLVDLGAHRLKDLARPERIWTLSHPDLPPVHKPLRTLDSFKHNLPAQTTPLIGRRSEIRAIADELAAERLVTLTGAGGVGKTRLAAQVGAELVASFPGGVWWVELAPIADAAAIPPALLAAMGASDDGVRPPMIVAIDRLAKPPALLIVDNCEHLVAATGDLVATLLANCPTVRVLCTSREPVGLPGEVVWRVPSLDTPSPGGPRDVASLGDFDAVRLFLDRARRARPQLDLTDEQAGAVADICVRLDGIPLAIELAAARCRQLPPERIAAELADRFRLLTGGSRTLLARQQTLLASVEWSHDLLDDIERVVLRRLAVFAGPFRWDAAEAVVIALGDVDRWTVVDVLGRLVDKSMVQLEDGGTYRLLETVRQFVLERLRAAGETAAVRDAHAAWWTAELTRLDARQPTWDTMRLCNEHAADLRAALDWLEPDLDRRHELLALVGLCWTWDGRNDDVLHYAERWLFDPIPEMLESSWARAVGACAPAGFTGLREQFWELYRHANDVLLRDRDGRGLAPLQPLRGDPSQPLDELVTVIALALEQHCDRLVAPYVHFYLADTVGMELLVAVEPLVAPLEAALQRDRGPHPVYAVGHLEPCDEHVKALTVLQGLDRADDRFLFGRAVGAVWAAVAAFLHRDLFLLDEALGRLAVLRRVPIGELWFGYCAALRSTILGSRPDDSDVAALAAGTSSAGIAFRYPVVRILLALGEGAKAEHNMARFDKPGLAAILGPIIEAVKALHDGRVNDADDALHRSVTGFVQHPLRCWRADTFELLAVVASNTGDHRRAARLCGVASRVRDETGYAFRFADQEAWLTAAIVAGSAALGDDGWDAAVTDGAALDDDTAAAFANRARGERRRPSVGWDALTPTELQVVTLVAEGLSNPQIAARLVMGTATVKTHLSSAMRKVGVGNRTELAAEVVRRR